MKVQFDTGRLRLRIGHAELAALMGGDALSTQLAFPGIGWGIEIALADGLDLTAIGQQVRLALPRADVVALAARAPARDGLRYALDLPSGPLDLRFEVDLHDGRARAR